jgi:hypothetical protein
MTTQKRIENLIAELAKAAGLTNNKKSAIEKNHEYYLTYENAAVYGGYRLIMVSVKNGSHSGAFGFSSTEPRVKGPVFIVKLEAILAGIKTEIKRDSLTITAREWLDKVNGNSYFAALVTFNNKQIKVPFQYGYEDQYLQATAEQLQKDGILNNDVTIYNLGRYCRENNIEFNATIKRDCLKRDVKALVS